MRDTFELKSRGVSIGSRQRKRREFLASSFNAQRLDVSKRDIGATDIRHQRSDDTYRHHQKTKNEHVARKHLLANADQPWRDKEKEPERDEEERRPDARYGNQDRVSSNVIVSISHPGWYEEIGHESFTTAAV